MSALASQCIEGTLLIFFEKGSKEGKTKIEGKTTPSLMLDYGKEHSESIFAMEWGKLRINTLHTQPKVI